VIKRRRKTLCRSDPEMPPGNPLPAVAEAAWHLRGEGQLWNKATAATGINAGGM
jgi:hypothetical protein